MTNHDHDDCSLCQMEKESATEDTVKTIEVRTCEPNMGSLSTEDCCPFVGSASHCSLTGEYLESDIPPETCPLRNGDRLVKGTFK